MNIDTQLLSLSERLQDAVKVCYTAPENEDQGYPYATGYSKSAMQGVIEDLTRIIEQLNDFDNSCPYCGGDCYNNHDNACDGFLGDIDELVQQQEQEEN